MGFIRRKIEARMRDTSADIGRGGGLGALLLLLSFGYGGAVRLRNTLYSVGLLKTRRLPCKVISVGNITVGGSGKTPVAMLIASLLKERGRRVVILSRGYKRSTGGSILTVSDGEKLLLKPQEAGDEPYLMAERLKGVPVVVGADRVAAGMMAVEKFAPDVIVLDDGFQHIRLHRDLNILLMDSSFGFGSGRLLPRGILREPLRGINRADIAMVKGVGLRERDTDRLKRFKLPAITFTYSPGKVVDLKSGEVKDLEFIRGRKVVALAGIADPKSFFTTIEDLGARVTMYLPYPDHHFYTRADLEVIKKATTGTGRGTKGRKGNGNGAASGEGDLPVILTTEKDAVKLRRYAREQALPPVYALTIDVALEEPGLLEELLKSFLKG